VFLFQAEDGIRDWSVNGVQTCALPIWAPAPARRREARLLARAAGASRSRGPGAKRCRACRRRRRAWSATATRTACSAFPTRVAEIGRASCRGRGEIAGGGGSLERNEER